MKVEIIDWPPTVIVDGKVVYQEEPLEDKAPELKPCPFCGESVARPFEDDDGNHTVVCSFTHGGCGATCGYIRMSGEDAAAYWNTRAND